MKYDLVFEGGGAKGMVFVGAMQEFEARGHTYQRLLGTSAGAITATLLAAGYSAAEMLAVLAEREDGKSVFEGFMGIPTRFERAEIEQSLTYELLQNVDIPLIPEVVEARFDHLLINALMAQPGYRNVFSFVELGGWFSAHRFVSWLERKLDTGQFRGRARQFSRMTLAEFFAATGTELTVIATDTIGERMLVLNHITAPNCPVVWAVRMSMSIPLIWPEVEWLAEWGQYQNKDITGNLIVDGGLLSNFPLELFVSNHPDVLAVMGSETGDAILGLLIDETLPVEGAPAIAAAGLEARLGKLRIVRRITRLVNTATQAHDKIVIDKFKNLVARLPAKGFGTTEFDMSNERRAALVAAGQKHTADFFNRVSIAALPPAPDADVADYADRVAIRILQTHE